MRILFSRRAVRDLEDIGDYIARASPLRARSFVAELRRQCEKITLAPLSYPAREDISPGLRVCPHRRYLIFYRLEKGGIRIVRIANGARDIFAFFETGPGASPAKDRIIADLPSFRSLCAPCSAPPTCSSC